MRQVAAALLDDTGDIADRMAERLHTVVPELAADPGGLLTAQTRAACRSNVGQILNALARGAPVDDIAAPPEAIEYARSYVQRDLALGVLLGSTASVRPTFSSDGRPRWSPTRIRPGAGDGTGGEHGLACVRGPRCNDLVAEYGRTRERWVRTPDAVRAETARAVLDGTLRDERKAGRILGHELSRRHHLAAVVWESGQDPAHDPHVLERVASVVGEALARNDPLLALLGD